MRAFVMLFVLLAAVGVGCRARSENRETVALHSSVIRRVAYDRPTQTLVVLFPNGSIYAYAGVPERDFEGLKTAPSAGAYFHAHIRNGYASTRVIRTATRRAMEED